MLLINTHAEELGLLHYIEVARGDTPPSATCVQRYALCDTTGEVLISPDICDGLYDTAVSLYMQILLTTNGPFTTKVEAHNVAPVPPEKKITKCHASIKIAANCGKALNFTPVTEGFAKIPVQVGKDSGELFKPLLEEFGPMTTYSMGDFLPFHSTFTDSCTF